MRMKNARETEAASTTNTKYETKQDEKKIPDIHSVYYTPRERERERETKNVHELKAEAKRTESTRATHDIQTMNEHEKIKKNQEKNFRAMFHVSSL